MATTDEKSNVLKTLFNKLPPNMRLFVSDLMGKDELITNEDFTEEQLNVMKETAEKAIGEGKDFLSYGDYPKGYMNYNKNFIEKMFDPDFQMRTSIGSANIKINDQGEVILTDQFNFNDAKDVNSLNDLYKAAVDIFGTDGAYNKFRKLGTYFGSPSGEGAPIKLNLGKLDT